MEDAVFYNMLDRLREGKLVLQQGKHELRDHARQHMGDLMNYVAALEAGFRMQTDRLTAYRGQARGKTLGQIVGNQWSDGACLGYAAMALIQYGMPCDQTVALLELMEELMEQFGQEYAAEYHQGLKEGRAPVPLETERSGQ